MEITDDDSAFLGPPQKPLLFIFQYVSREVAQEFCNKVEMYTQVWAKDLMENKMTCRTFLQGYINKYDQSLFEHIQVGPFLR